MNLLFLPIDTHCTRDGGDNAGLDASTLALLDEICREAQAQVVLCSSEKSENAVAALNEFFTQKGNKHTRIVGVTPQCYGSHRGHEVMAFLENFGEEVTHYAVVDQTGEYFGWQPCFKVAPNKLNPAVGYEVLRQLNPDSQLLAKWEAQYGFGDLLTTYERPKRREVSYS